MQKTVLMSLTQDMHVSRDVFELCRRCCEEVVCLWSLILAALATGTAAAARHGLDLSRVLREAFACSTVASY